MKRKTDGILIDLVIPELAAIAVVDVAITILIQRTISDAEKMYHLQRKLNTHMKDLQEMSKRNASQTEMAAKQNEMTKASMESMMNQMKAMPILFLVSVSFYFFLLPYLFPAGQQYTLNLIVTQIKYNGFQDNIYFIIFTVVISLAVQFALRKRDERVFGQKYRDIEAANNANAPKSQ